MGRTVSVKGFNSLKIQYTGLRTNKLSSKEEHDDGFKEGMNDLFYNCTLRLMRID